jgi:hypothetical protein
MKLSQLRWLMTGAMIATLVALSAAAALASGSFTITSISPNPF